MKDRKRILALLALLGGALWLFPGCSSTVPNRDPRGGAVPAGGG